MAHLLFDTSSTFTTAFQTSGASLYEYFSTAKNIAPNEIYFVTNGKLVHPETVVPDGAHVHVVPKLAGGKGGFGSMLRAIGAQIEKTTNREACRDLSGRRLRDINEEKRLKTWLAQQVDREKEAAERKRKKLEKMCEPPRHEFKDEDYFRQQSEWTERVEDAVLQGLQASPTSSASNLKRKGESSNKQTNKKIKLWIDDELDDSDISDSDESDQDVQNKPCSSITKSNDDEEPSCSTDVTEERQKPTCSTDIIIEKQEPCCSSSTTSEVQEPTCSSNITDKQEPTPSGSKATTEEQEPTCSSSNIKADEPSTS